MAVQNAFTNNLEHCLRDYVIQVRGGALNQTSNNTLVRNLYGGGYVPTTKHGGLEQNSSVSPGAALVTANFAEEPNAVDEQICTFSKRRVTVTLGPYNNPPDLPVYLIPYEGGKGRGVKLPAHGSDAFAVAYAMTATQDGCTVEISGTQQAPFASHTNVIDQQGPNRQAKINQRLEKLIQRFTNQDGTANPSLNRTQFGFYDRNPLLAPITVVNYNLQNQAGANNNANQLRFRRESRTLGHVNYLFQMTDHSLAQCRNRAIPPAAIVVGRRDHNGWVFYYNVWRPIEVNVTKVYKAGSLVVKRQVIQGNRGPKIFRPNVILDYGELWPNHQSHLLNLTL